MKKLIRVYVLWAYGVFFSFILLIGLTMLVLNSTAVPEILKVVSAWTPTIVFIVMFRKIYPKDNPVHFIKRQFRERVKITTVLSVILLQFSILAAMLLLASALQSVPIKALVTTSWITLLIMFGNSLIRGPLGEQLGWRGFLLNEMLKMHNPLKSALIVGVIWGFWHLPLWFLSGYAGLQLIQYIAVFMVYIMAASVIITAFYNLNRNLLIPIFIHQLANFFIMIQLGDVLQMITHAALLYFVVAVILILINYQKCLYGNALLGKKGTPSAV